MSGYISPELRSLVSARADGICEYCLIAEDDSYYRHEIDHIISLKHDGLTVPENLALACVFCNRSKGSDIASFGNVPTERIRFYNPRTDIWSEHHRLVGARILGLTEIGIVTIRVLQIDQQDRVSERVVLNKVGRYPNEAANSILLVH